MASIVLEGISKNFSEVKALVDIRQKIDPGVFFTLLGPSGCGKTTLLRTIAGFYKQDAGHLYLSGRLIDAIPAHQRDTGMVFQSYAIFPHMTVFENVAFGLKTRKVNAKKIKERVKTALERVHLQGYEHRTPDQLSGGQQQRVGLARAMVIEPQVLLMDEPLSNLDAKLRIDMRDEIRRVQKELNITTVYVTHDQEEALAISDKIAVMNYGVIQQVGKPWEIYKKPANIFVASFVGDMNFIDCAVEKMEGGMRIRIGKNQIPLSIQGKMLSKVRVAVRPEDLDIVTTAPKKSASMSCLPGIVEKSTFIGSLVRYTVRSKEGVTMSVERHKPQHEALLSSGTSVFVKMATDTLLYFDPDTGIRV